MPKVQNLPPGYDMQNSDKKVFKVPSGLKALLEEVACEIFRMQPDDIMGFIADFLESKLSGAPMKVTPKNTVPIPAGDKGAAIEAQKHQSILEAVASFDFSKMVNPEYALADEFKSGKPQPTAQKPANEQNPANDVKAKGYTPDDAAIEKQRAAIGISKIQFGKGVPPGISPSKGALFEKIDQTILQALELVDYLEKAVANYKADPYPRGHHAKGAEKTAQEILRNRPSRKEITDHVDVALANAFKLRDGIDSILRENSGDGPNAQDFEAEQRALLEQRQHGTFPIVPTSTLALLNRPSQAVVSEALVARVDKLNTVVARALALVEQLDGMDLTGEGEKDELEYLLEYGGVTMGEGSKPESQSIIGKGAEGLSPSQTALLQKATNDAVELLQNGGHPSPSQIQLLQSRGLISASQASILLAGGSLTPSQLQVLAEKNEADAKLALEAEMAAQKAVDEAIAILQAGGTLTPSQMQLLADRDLLSPSKLQTLAEGGTLTPSTIQAIADKNEAGNEALDEEQSLDQSINDAVELLKNGGKLSPSQIQLLADQNLITPSKAQVLAEGGILSPSQVQVIVNKNDAAIEESQAKATAEALDILKNGGTLSPAQVQLLKNQDIISESKAHILATGGTLSPSQIQVAAAKADALKTDAGGPAGRSAAKPEEEDKAAAEEAAKAKAEAEASSAPPAPQLSPSQARVQKENDALDLIRNGGHPTHSQIQVLADSGKISASQALALSQGNTVDLDAPAEAAGSSQPKVPSTTGVNAPKDLEIESENFLSAQLRIMAGILNGTISIREAPMQTAMLTLAFILGMVASYQALRSVFGRGGNTLPDLEETEESYTRKCPL